MGKLIKTTETKRGLKIVTPPGRAAMPFLNTPSVKFNPLGVYSTGLILPGNDPATLELIAIIDAQLAESEAAAKKEAKKPKVKVNDPPYENETDEDGNETGNVKFKFKLAAKRVFKREDGGEDTVTSKVALFDASGKKLDPTKKIGGGTLMAVAAEIRPYFVAATGAGLTMSLIGVQVIELVEYGGEVSFGSAGFEAVEGGYTNEPDDASSELSEPAPAADTASASAEADF